MSTQVQAVPKEQYHRAKWWQLVMFPFNNTATNLYLLLMNFISYYLVGYAGIAVVLTGSIMTAMRIWDGVTDPIIGYIVDKTDGKFGKNRPFMVVGNVMLAVMAIIIYKTTHLVPKKYNVIYFIFLYAIYIIGYTIQCVVTKSAQTCLTNDPKQRPLFALFDGIYNSFVFTGMAFVISKMWIPRYGDFNLEFFNHFLWFVVIVSGCLTVLSIIAIWSKDRREYFGTGAPQKITFKDYWQVIKNNRAIQMLVVAASTDKLCAQIGSNAVVAVMLYGIVSGNYGVYGEMSLIMLIPNMLIMFFGIGYIARKLGQKRALVLGSVGGIIFYALLILLFIFGTPTNLSISNLNLFTILFLLLMILARGSVGVAGSIVIPMTADCADYETYRSGRYVPGLMGTLFSFVDKLISSLSYLVVSLAIAAIGFTDTQPTPDTPYTTAIFWTAVLLMFGMPILGLVANLIAMKFYPLDKEMMEKIQTKIAAIKAQHQAGGAVVAPAVAGATVEPGISETELEAGAQVAEAAEEIREED